MESINYHLELTPAQLKITHTAHAIRAIQLDVDLEPNTPDRGGDDPPPGAAA